jgi:hypothetical protein
MHLIVELLRTELTAQEKHLREQLGLDIKVIALADRSGIKIEEKGFGAAALQKLSKQKALGTRLFDRDSPLTLHQLRRDVLTAHGFRYTRHAGGDVLGHRLRQLEGLWATGRDFHDDRDAAVVVNVRA